MYPICESCGTHRYDEEFTARGSLGDYTIDEDLDLSVGRVDISTESEVKRISSVQIEVFCLWIDHGDDWWLGRPYVWSDSGAGYISLDERLGCTILVPIDIDEFYCYRWIRRR